MAEHHLVWQHPGGNRNGADEVRLVVDSPGSGRGLQVVRGRGNDCFIVDPEAGVVAVFLILDQPGGGSLTLDSSRQPR
ncbi:MAG: hypothetical protein HPY69_03860 [Armatimonadetes bacterium]|nr:hypothetical protein [Armatimonadota bacterium]